MGVFRRGVDMAGRLAFAAVFVAGGVKNLVMPALAQADARRSIDMLEAVLGVRR